MHSSVPTPGSSPIKPGCRPFDDASPTQRAPAYLFAGAHLGFEYPRQPSFPTPTHPQNVADVKPTQPPTSKPDLSTHPEANHGPKHPSFTNIGSHLNQSFPPDMLSELEHARRKKHQTHRTAWSGTGGKELDIPGAYPDESSVIALDRSLVGELSDDQKMDEDYPDELHKAVLNELGELAKELEHELEQCRQRAKEESQRRREEATSDVQAEKMWEVQESGGEEAQKHYHHKVTVLLRDVQEEVKRLRQLGEQRRTCGDRGPSTREDEDDILHRTHELYGAWEELEREKLAEVERLLQEEKIGRAKARLDREERLRDINKQVNFLTQRDREQCEEIERLRREEVAHSIWRAEQERLVKEQQDRYVRKQRERLARQSKEGFAAWMQQAREKQECFAREQQEHGYQTCQTALEEQIYRQFIIYEAKWQELVQTSNTIPPIHVQELPWPVFGVVSSAEQITYQDVRTFLLHPLRPDMQDKSTLDKVRSEVLRFHPDKFSTWVLLRVQRAQQAVAKKIAGAIVTVLTRLMTEEQNCAG